MTKKLIRRARNRMKQDLFSKTQNRLTFRYSALLMIFLLLFVFIVYSLVYVVISSNQQQSLNMLLKQETKFVKSLLVEQSDRVEDEYQDIVVAREDAFFYYVVSPEGQLLMGSEASEGLRPKLLNLINGWIPIENEVRKERIETIRPNVEQFERNGHAEDEFKVSIDLLMTGQPIFYKGEFLGMLYIGKNVSFLYQLLKWLLVIMLSLTVLFVGVAIYMSRLMSKRAMIPIETAFLKQKEFVADASHELRTPLSVMLSSINALEMQDEVNEDPFSKKLVGNMKAEVKRMTKLVSDLLTLARSDASKNQQAFNRFDVKKMVEKVIQSVEPLAHSKNISLHLEAPKQIDISGDEEKLTQLMYILLDNGIKYTTPGGQVEVFVKQRTNSVEIRVTDTGVGIHKDEQKRIFDRFYRADKSRSRQMGGHGLGLAIAKWIVDMHKGTIKVDSEPEKGSTFRINLPQ
ncbi:MULTISPECIES: ATP-binding protein [Bacillaceae]|uniref:sensor histidine kinase n=1 Tax=Bacillaceae TaxID=186817 RepID=UPI00104511D6|nr:MULTISPECIES: ATP-binding protein [Bacillaceae]TDB54948.1 sensor histidine kinase [Bacillus sp. CBEL-1]